MRIEQANKELLELVKEYNGTVLNSNRLKYYVKLDGMELYTRFNDMNGYLFVTIINPSTHDFEIYPLDISGAHELVASDSTIKYFLKEVINIFNRPNGPIFTS